MKNPKIIILYATAGGGHITAARSISNSFEKLYKIEAECVNALDELGIDALKDPGKPYLFFQKYAPILHKLTFEAINTRLGTFLFNNILWIITRSKAKKFVERHPADLYISVYPMYNAFIHKALKFVNSKASSMTVITDISYLSYLWFDKNLDLTIVPTHDVYGTGFKRFYKYSNRIEIIGLPIYPIYFQKFNRKTLREELKLNKKTIVLVGGGEGMGDIYNIAKAIDEGNEDITLVIISGRNNHHLYERLAEIKWKNDIRVFKWMDEFWKYEVACDLMITKAGPGTLWEGLTLGRYMIIYDFVVGQEEYNADYVMKRKMGLFENRPIEIARLVQESKIDEREILEPLLPNYADKIAKRAMELFEK